MEHAEQHTTPPPPNPNPPPPAPPPARARPKLSFTPLVDAIKSLVASPFIKMGAKLAIIYIEVLSAFIRIARGAPAVEGIFDQFFKNFFGTILDGNFHETINGMEKVHRLLLFQFYGESFGKFVDILNDQTHPVLKIILLIKAVLLLAVMAAVLFHIFNQTLKHRNMGFLFTGIKLFMMFAYITCGASVILSSFDSDKVLEFGGMYSVPNLKPAMLEHKLLIIVLTIIAVFDIYRQFWAKADAPPPPKH